LTVVADAWQSLAALRAGETTSTALVENAFATIDEWDERVNAFTVTLRDEAMAEARSANAIWRDALATVGATAPVPPLLGIPVTVKDHIWLADQPATNGSMALRDFIPDVDAVPVARLKKAGAIVIGKTNNPEFCYRGYTDNDLWGRTNNPWALNRTCGGSSGGAGASVAYGAAPIALGTDGGGSIRIPAAFCGVVGHKPTFGLIPKLPGFRGWPTLSVDGPLTRSVRDAALAVSVMAGASPEDDLSWPVPIGGLVGSIDRPVDWSRYRIAVSEDLGWAPVETAVRTAFRQAVGVLSDAGAAVTEAAPDTPYPTPLWNAIALAEGFASEGRLLEKHADQIMPGTRDIIESGRAITAAQYLDAQFQRVDYSRRWAEFFVDHDVLLTPSMPLPAFGVDVESPTAIDGVPVDPFFDDWCMLSLPANLAGLPACAIPTGLFDGLPVGMQVIGARWSDATVLEVAAGYEQLSPWTARTPPHSPVGS
jgi:Asp-tRNA(Asn)/Glu-tRNA(Gln) amidotransferase A subunit family amidase